MIGKQITLSVGASREFVISPCRAESLRSAKPRPAGTTLATDDEATPSHLDKLENDGESMGEKLSEEEEKSRWW